jgi:hypothetical protein
VRALQLILSRLASRRVDVRRRELEHLLDALRERWTGEEWRSDFVSDKRGAPVLLYMHWREPCDALGDRFLTLLVCGDPRVRSMIVYARARGAIAELIDMVGTRHLNRGLGTLALVFLERILCELGVRDVEGWLSPVDLDHRPRQLHFYEKNGYDVTIEESHVDGRITKTLDCSMRLLDESDRRSGMDAHR